MNAGPIARRRMVASRLTAPEFASPAEAVGWHLAMQAQDYAPASWSIGQRSKALAADDVDAALADSSIVRTHVLRQTWHFVAREDIRWLLALSGPRVQRANQRRYAELGLDARARGRAERLIVSALAGGNRLTRKELASVLERARFDPEGQRLPYVLAHCELEAVIGSGGLSGKQQTYALLDDRVPPSRSLDREDALAELTRRYLRSHGPATANDLSWWSGLTMADLRKAVDRLDDEVARETVGDLTLWSIPGEGTPPPAGGVHLLQAYDELVVGFRESRFLGDPRAEGARVAWRDRSLPSGVILFDGRLAGHWSRRVVGSSIRLEARLYDPKRRGIAGRVETAAEELGAFFGRPVELTITPL
jgi:winged helix DNA-binding protein